MSTGYRAVQWSPGKRRYDLVLAGLLALYLATFLGLTALLRPEITVETALVRAFGTAAFLLLHVVLSIGPLARFDPRFLPLLWNRRHLGVTTFVCALAHGAFALVQFHALGDRNPLVSLLVSNTRFDSIAHFPFQQLGAAALVLLFLLAATSHDFWLAQLTAPVWKALHAGAYAAYALVVGHVALGALQDERATPPVAMFALGVSGILGLHLAAALRERRIDREVALATGDGFVEAGRVSAIAEGRATVVSIGGERVAIFRHQGRLSALSNVCQHQNGPLGEGRIVDGCVTCPWHGYQYRPEDGASPPPFTERVPTFRLRVEGERILVDPRPLPAGTRVEPARFDPAIPAPADRRAFFVGYLPPPAALVPFLRGVTAALSLLFVTVAGTLAASQRALGPGQFDPWTEVEIEGWLRAEPLPALWMPQGGSEPPRVVPLVGRGKHGPAPEVLAWTGRPVKLRGSWIRRGPAALFEVAGAAAVAQTAELTSGADDPAPVGLGHQRLVGEVVDSKCYLGVMKPGDGKSHRDCAVRCISGGAPAALVARTRAGERFVLMLVSPAGRPLGPELLDLVAEPVAVTGEVVRLGDLPLLVTEPAAVVRLSPRRARGRGRPCGRRVRGGAARPSKRAAPRPAPPPGGPARGRRRAARASAGRARRCAPCPRRSSRGSVRCKGTAERRSRPRRRSRASGQRPPARCPARR